MEGLRKIVKPENSFNRDKKYGSHYLENLQKQLDARATNCIKQRIDNVQTQNNE